MYKNLIEEARNEGIDRIVVEALIRKAGKRILLVEDLSAQKPVYELPSTSLKEQEILPQAIERAVIEITGMHLKEVAAYLGHYDLEGARHYHFVVEVHDPYAIEENTKFAHAWLEVQEAVGYPIRDDLRGMLDRYVLLGN